MVSVPDRALDVKFSRTSNVTVSLPVPSVLEVSVIQLVLLAAIQLHPAAVVRFTLPAPPDIEKKPLVDEREQLHGSGLIVACAR